MTGTEGQDAAFDAPAVARRLLRTIRSGSLATLDSGSGAPFCSLVTVATDVDGSRLLLLSRLSTHTRNLDADPRASLLLCATGKGDPLAHPRLTLSGRIVAAEEPRIRARFLARHPKAELYAGFADFGFRRLVPDGAHLNGGFARAAQLGPADLLADMTGTEALVDRMDGSIAHMNEDHLDAIRLYATRLAGAPDAEWRATGVDPDGMDMAAGDLVSRVDFPTRVTDGPSLRKVLVDLAAKARAGGAGPSADNPAAGSP